MKFLEGDRFHRPPVHSIVSNARTSGAQKDQSPQKSNPECSLPKHLGMESRFTRPGIRASVSYCVARSLCKILEDEDDDDDKPLLAKGGRTFRYIRAGGLVNQLEWTSARVIPPNNPWGSVVELGERCGTGEAHWNRRFTVSLCLMTRDRFLDSTWMNGCVAKFTRLLTPRTE